MDQILILDFGSQTTQLIGRRIREMGVYTEIIPGDSALPLMMPNGDIKGIILSGSPESVYESGAAPDKKIYDCGLPLLGICYGLQRMTHDLGGQVKPLPKREYGRIGVSIKKGGGSPPRSSPAFGGSSASPLSGGAPPATPPGPAERFLEGLKDTFTAWMSHGDTLTRLAPGFAEAGTSETGYPAVVVHDTKPWFGLQFHPEVSHTEGGNDILAAFVFGVCGCAAGWSLEHYVEETRAFLAERIGKNPALLLISGGVDSTVAGALLLKTLPSDQVHLMYMDTGLMRKDETKTVKASLQRLGAKHIHIVYCEHEFLNAIKGLSDPEAKRKAIGDLFITIQEREVARLGLPDSYFLAQGTLYTDLIESGKGVGKKARLIKSHHNVGSPLVEAKRKAGRIIEPLDKLYKDEARRLGRFLGVDEEVVRRHPFPGPGLAVRILGEVTKEKCDILREADAIYIEELKRRKSPGGQSLYDAIWQAFAVLLPVRSVGVAGDARKYGWVLALRAITSADGMTADVYPFAAGDLLEIATRITNTVKDIGRVTYDISSKPPATIEWE
ncbi:MAG: glutamine-hydrolyzing GMP synthase [Treponema sp.]|jgi:GMP synthase (glutamine-hydrolysing)|nr:glutamine-hydrolyzing GMP synthase [Treponema sp.]